MANDWRCGKLNELVEFLPKRTIKKGTVAPFIAMADIPENSREPTNISQKEFKGGGSKFYNGDTVFARITPCLQNGKTAKISGLEDGDIAHGSTEFIILGAKESTDQDYLYYLSRLPEFRAYAESRMEGSTGRQRVSWQALAEYELSFPPKQYRGRIGTFLSSLDDKIELNRQTNETLEQMAQALFKSWFVDFDPVIDNALEAGNTIPDELQDRAARRQQQLAKPDHQPLPDDIRQLFPSEFELTDELGWVPMGWDMSRLCGFINFTNGKTMKSCDGGIYPLYGANGVIGRTNEARSRNAIIIGRVGAYCGAIEYCSGSFWPSDNTIVATSNETEEMLPFILYQLKYLELNQYAGGAAQPLLNQVTLNSIQVSVPGSIVRTLFNTTVISFLEKIDGVIHENASLMKLRDTLLPKLISGELRLPADALSDAEQQLTAATS